MESARQIVSALLEDGEEFNAREYLQQGYKPDEVNVESALKATRFYHRKLKYKGSDRPIEVRKMGRVKTWVRQPDRFRVPVRYGMYDSFYIDNDNAHEWAVRPEE